MLLVVLLGLAATAAALPLTREVAKEHEGVVLPIYKPWYNAYGSGVFGSQYSQYDKAYPNYYFRSGKRFPPHNYDSKHISPFHFNYFSKYMRPEMMYKNFYEYPDMFQSFINSGYRYNHDMNTFGYTHYPYHNTENFKHTYPSYDVDYSNYMYRPYSPEYMSGYTRYPYYNDMNTDEYTYKPYSHEYKYGNDNFKNIMFYPYYDKEYAFFNSPEYANFKNTFYPYHDKEYTYPNYPEYNNFKNTFYPYHDKEYTYPNYPEYNNFKNTFYPYHDKEYTHLNYPEYANFKNTFYPYHDKEYTYLNYPEYNNFKNTFYPYHDKEYTYPNYPEYNNFKNTFYPYHDKEYTYPNYPEYNNFKNTFYPFKNYVNKFDYQYRPFSLEYTKGYLENFRNTRYPFYNNMKDYDYTYRPYSPEYMNFKNTHYPFQNNADRFDYTYKPYFPRYPQNFVDMSYPSNDKNGYGYTNYPGYMNFKNTYYPFHENKFDYKYRPYTPEYTYGYMQDSNTRYPFYNKMNGYDYTYKQNYPENTYGYKNTEYPFYNNYYFGRMNYGAQELPKYMDNMRFKRENVGDDEHLKGERFIRQDTSAAADFDTEFQNHDVNVDLATPRSKRDVDSDVLEGEQLTGRQDRTSYVPEHEPYPITRSRRDATSIPERFVDDLHVVPKTNNHPTWYNAY